MDTDGHRFWRRSPIPRWLCLVRRQRSNVTAGKTVETVGILRGARTTQLKLRVNESGLGPAMYLDFFVRVLASPSPRRSHGLMEGTEGCLSVFICVHLWLL